MDLLMSGVTRSAGAHSYFFQARNAVPNSCSASSTSLIDLAIKANFMQCQKYQLHPNPCRPLEKTCAAGIADIAGLDDTSALALAMSK